MMFPKYDVASVRCGACACHKLLWEHLQILVTYANCSHKQTSIEKDIVLHNANDISIGNCLKFMMNSSNIGQENETKGNDDDGMLGNVNNDNNMNVVNTNSSLIMNENKNENKDMDENMNKEKKKSKSKSKSKSKNKYEKKKKNKMKNKIKNKIVSQKKIIRNDDSWSSWRWIGKLRVVKINVKKSETNNSCSLEIFALEDSGTLSQFTFAVNGFSDEQIKRIQRIANRIKEERPCLCFDCIPKFSLINTKDVNTPEGKKKFAITAADRKCTSCNSTSNC